MSVQEDECRQDVVGELPGGRILIRQQLLSGGDKPIFIPTKGKRARTIDLAPETVELLKAHKRHQAALKLRHRQEYHDHGLVFTKEWDDGGEKYGTLGQPLSVNNLGQREFARLIKAAKVKAITLHGLRHTCASLLLSAGVQPNVVQQRLGHKRIEITLDRLRSRLAWPATGCGATTWLDSVRLMVIENLSADVRYSFTVQFLVGATMLVREAERIESEKGDAASEPEQMAHRAHVVGAIMQATAALESEIWEVMVHGPGHHGGSAKIDGEAAVLLQPMAGTIDGERVLDRYALVLHLLQKAPLDKGAQPWQDADLVVKLRNEIVHYKSAWRSELERRKFVRQLRAKRHGGPPFERSHLFPRADLSATCGFWAVQSCAAFLDAFCINLGFPERLDPYRKRV